MVGGRTPRDARFGDSDAVGAAESFVRSVEQIRAVPTAFVRYRREAWCADEGDDRLTMDREVVWVEVIKRHSVICWRHH